MITYILQVSACWLVFYLLYYAWLSRETFFQLNRWYLLISLLLGLLIPALPPIYELFSESSPVITYIAPLSLDFAAMTIQVTAPPVAEPVFDWWTIIGGIYGLGAAVALFRLLRGLWQIARLYRRAEKVHLAGYTLALTDTEHLPFSFLRVVFKSKQQPLDSFTEEKITAHELAHVVGGHTFDVLFIEVLGVVLWWHPLVYLYRRSLRIVHEYIADAAAIRQGNKKQYGHLLIKQSQSGLEVALANHFIHSQLKKRITMITRSRSRRQAFLKYLLSIPVLIMAMLFCTNREALAYQAPVEQKVTPKKSEVSASSNFLSWPEGEEPYILVNGKEASGDWRTKIQPEDIQSVEVLKGQAALDRFGDRARNGAVLITLKSGDKERSRPRQATSTQLADHPPVFPGCEELSGEEQHQCSQKGFLMHIYRQIQYPAEARQQRIEGTVVLKYTIGTDGQIRDAQIQRGLGAGCDEEVLRVITTSPAWIPARKEGKAVATEMVLPVKFKLGDEQTNEQADTPRDPTEVQVTVLGEIPKQPTVWKVVEEMPRFPGCEDEVDPAERKKCAELKLISFIGSQVKYPKESLEEGLSGIVVVSFVVQKDGSIRDIKIVRDIGPGFGEEVVQMVKAMPAWVPGQQQGKAVDVQVNLPVRFELPQESEQEEVDTKKPQLQQPAKILSVHNFKALPNPTKGWVQLQFQAAARPTTIRVITADGREVLRQELPQFNGTFDERLDLQATPAGILILSIQQAQEIYTTQLIRQ